MNCTNAALAEMSALGLVLVGFVALVFGLTVVKVERGDLSATPPSAEGGN